MYPIHKVCGNQVLLNLTPNIRLTTGISISNNGLKIGMGDLEVINEDFSGEFICIRCGKVELVDIQCFCSNCGHFFDLKNMYKLKNSGGVYCGTCVDELNLVEILGSKICLETIFKKVLFK